jgi:hypothetical protein
MPGTVHIDLARLISDHWLRFSPQEQQDIEQRIHDLVLLSLNNALDAAVTPQAVVPTTDPAQIPIVRAAPRPEALTAAQVPFGDASNYKDYTYDDFATLCEQNGVPPTAGIGHWFNKSNGVEFDHSTPEQRRKIYSEMLSFYSTLKTNGAPVGRVVAQGGAPVAVVERPYVQVSLNTCPSCGQGSKFVQGGISKKTGKPYTGFYACNNRNECKTEYNGAQKTVTWTTDSDWTRIYTVRHPGGGVA